MGAEAERACAGESVCVPVRDMDAVRVGGQLDLAAVAAAVRQPAVVDLDAGIVAVALPAELRRRALADLDAPAFTLPDLDGVPHSLDEWAGRKRLLVTFSSWCGCRYDLPGLAGAPRRAGARGVHGDRGGHRPVAPTTSGRSPTGLTMPVLYDPQHLLTELYAISNVPDRGVDRRGGPDRPAQRPRRSGPTPSPTSPGPSPRPTSSWCAGGCAHGEVPLTEDEARDAVADLSDDEVLARLHFRIAAEAHRRGDAATTRRHVLRAGELAPDDLTIWRAGMPLIGEDPFGQDFLDRYDEWRAKGQPGPLAAVGADPPDCRCLTAASAQAPVDPLAGG